MRKLIRWRYNLNEDTFILLYILALPLYIVVALGSYLLWQCVLFAMGVFLLPFIADLLTFLAIVSYALWLIRFDIIALMTNYWQQLKNTLEKWL